MPAKPGEAVVVPGSNRDVLPDYCGLDLQRESSPIAQVLVALLPLVVTGIVGAVIERQRRSQHYR